MSPRRMFAFLVFTVVAMVTNFSRGTDDDQASKAPDAQESAFLRQSVQDDVFQERLGQYAAEHAAIDQVKALGKQLATDHKADREQIQQIATDHHFDLVRHDADLTLPQKAIYDRLTAKAGKDFDKDYTKLVVAEHNRVIALYERERDQAVDAFVREYAGKMVSPLQEHLKIAQDAQKAAWAD